MFTAWSVVVPRASSVRAITGAKVGRRPLLFGRLISAFGKAQRRGRGVSGVTVWVGSSIDTADCQTISDDSGKRAGLASATGSGAIGDEPMSR